MMQGRTVQCNTEVTRWPSFGGHHGIKGGVSKKRERLYIFCVFILYANNVYCSRPKMQSVHYQSNLLPVLLTSAIFCSVAKVGISATDRK